MCPVAGLGGPRFNACGGARAIAGRVERWPPHPHPGIREAGHGMPDHPAVFLQGDHWQRASAPHDGGVLPGEIVLRDGTPALIWPLLPTDRAVVREGFAALSDRSRYRRFLSSTPNLTEPMLRRLVDEVDSINHVALILVALPIHDEERLAGVGRLIHYVNDPTAADIAVTVVDQWQGRGVATALVQALLARRPEGVTQLRTLTAADNIASLAMLATAGPVSTRMEQGVVEVRVDVSARKAGWAQDPNIAAALNHGIHPCPVPP